MEATNGQEGVPNVSVPGPPQPMLTVAAVARRLGVAPPTLRTWDRRYGLGPSAHTAGAHRRYSPGDVARLMVMRRLTLEGVPPADAAKLALAGPVQPDGVGFGRSFDDALGVADLPTSTGALVVPPAPREEPVDVDLAVAPGRDPLAGPARVPTPPGAPVRDLWSGRVAGAEPAPADDYADLFSEADLRVARDAGRADPDPDADVPDSPWRAEPGLAVETPWLGVLRAPDRSARSSSGGGRVVALPDGTPQVRGLARAAMSLDTYETTRLLREAMRRHGVVRTWEQMIMPVLRALGERTAATGDGIDVEHAFSEVVLAVLRGAVLGLRQPRNPAPVILVCAENEYHSMPIHVLAAALAEREIGTRLLGSGLPVHALASAVRRTGPLVVVVYARMPDADAAPLEVVRRQRPAPRLLLAGPGWDATTIPSGVRTATSLTDAIDEVMLGVHA